MEVNRKELVDILGIIQPAVAQKDIVAQQQHAIFSGNYVSAFNGQIYISHPFPLNIQFSVKFDDLKTVLNSISDDLVQMGVEADKLIITSSDTKADLSTIVDDREMVTGIIDDLKKEHADWKLLPEDFPDALWLTAFSASRNMREGVIVGVLIDKEDVLSTDTRRASWYKLSEPLSDTFLVSSIDAIELSSFNLVEYTVGLNWVHFKTKNGALFSSRLLKGRPLPIKSLFNSTKETIAPFTLPDMFSQILTSMNKFMDGTATDPSKVIDVVIDNRKITCTATRERGSMRKEIPITLPESITETVYFQVNPHFFSQVLEKSTDISFHDLKNKSEVAPVAMFTSGDFRHLVLLPIVRKQ